MNCVAIVCKDCGKRFYVALEEALEIPRINNSVNKYLDEGNRFEILGSPIHAEECKCGT